MTDQTSNPFGGGYNPGATPPPIPPMPPVMPPQQIPPPWWAYPPPRRGGVGRWIFRFFIAIILLASIGMNISMALALAVRGETLGMDKSVIRHGQSDQTIAVYNVNGIIDDQAVKKFEEFFRQVKDDDKVKAIVTRVESPGGSVSASDQIHEMIARLRQQGKKVVVSMGGVAASGGYYISCGADHIVAEDTTITGSIGVIMGWVVLKGTLDKIGMEMIIMKSQDAAGWKDAISSFQKPDPRQRKYVQDLLDSIQNRFEDIVKEGRGDRLVTHKVTYQVAGEDEDAAPITRTETEPLNGKIYLATDALKLGLIDSIGYEEAAIDKAAQIAGLQEPKVVRYERRKGLAELLFDGQSKATLKISPELLDQLQTPRVMLMWKAE